MTLRRSNTEHARSVIHRTDDSIHHVRVGVVGRPGLFLDSLIEILRGSGFTTWWAGAASPTGGLIDRLAGKSTDLVLFNVGTAAPTQTELSLIGQLTNRGVRVVVIDGGDDQGGADECMTAGAVWAIDPWTAGFEELVSAMRMAYSLRSSHRRRGTKHKLVSARIISFDDAG
jgi:DNA-binding NarL/FixJ family response regulator